MSDKCYSRNNEDFNYYTLRDAVDGGEIGEVITVWEGEPVPFTTSEFIPNMVEHIGEAAYGDAGEWAEDFPDVTKQQEDELQELVAKVVQEWADKHGIHPRFHGVTNIKEIKARWVSEYEFEILEPKESQ